MTDVVVQTPTLRIGRLTTLPQVRREMIRVYREARSGTLPSGEATRLTFILQAIAKLIEQGDTEARLEELERMITSLNRNDYHIQ